MRNKYLLLALASFIIGLATLPFWLFINFIVLFRTNSMELVCEKLGIEPGGTVGSVPFDLKSYRCGGALRVLSDFEIAFYYATSCLIIISVLFITFCFVMHLKHRKKFI